VATAHGQFIAAGSEVITTNSYALVPFHIGEERFARDGARAVAERVAIAVLGADPRVRQLPDGRWAILAEAQGSPHIEECAFAVIDLETTGMRARGDDRITEVAVVLVHGERREVVFQRLVNPGRPIPSIISMVTGITNEMVAHAPPFEAIADELLGILSGRIFVAHNARFDWGFLDASFRRTRGLALTGPRLCTVRLARRLLRDVGSCGLDNLTRISGSRTRRDTGRSGTPT
jgi:DNA polymerase-3 subunit epsilon